MTQPDERLAAAAADLIALAMRAAKAHSGPHEFVAADKLHDQQKLFPRLTISQPHRGKDVHIRLTLNDPKTGRPRVCLFDGIAHARETH